MHGNVGHGNVTLTIRRELEAAEGGGGKVGTGGGIKRAGPGTGAGADMVCPKRNGARGAHVGSRTAHASVIRTHKLPTGSAEEFPLVSFMVARITGTPVLERSIVGVTASRVYTEFR